MVGVESEKPKEETVQSAVAEDGKKEDNNDKPDTDHPSTTGAEEDETVSASTGGAFEDGMNGSFNDTPPMPIMKYSRIFGLPRSSSSSSRVATSASIPSATNRTGTTGPLSSTCSCSSLAQVLLNPWNETGAETSIHPTLSYGGANALSTSPGPSSSSNHNQHEDPQQLLRSDLWSQQPFYILAAGFQNGKISLLSVSNGRPVVSQPQLTVREGSFFSNTPPPVVDVSFDSSGTVLAAIDQSGTCAVWELKYYPTLSKQQHDGSGSATGPSSDPASSSRRPTANAATSAASEAPNNNDNMFSSFMSALTGMPPSGSSSSASTTRSNINSNDNHDHNNQATNVDNNNTSSRPVLCLAASIIQVSRVTYPSNWQNPTCMCLDPAYKRKREKSFCVGFEDGRLLLTKRGGLFQRRNDTVLFQGSAAAASTATGGSSPSSPRGVESITWRGSLVAWADASGIKLMDVDTLTRIAHIDRPTGARPTLYPTISSFKPHLCFETTSTLLVCWGDCLMTMSIKEAPLIAAASSSSAPEERPRRSVECSMAWELEGVACGVVPMDKDHVAILALVSPDDDDDDEEDIDDDDAEGRQQRNDLEVQVLSRKDGNLLYCDSLPLIRSTATNNINADLVSPSLSHNEIIESATQYMMLSTFALPRMDDTAELEEFNTWSQNNPAVSASSAMEEFDMNAFLLSSVSGARDSNKPTFVDAHLQWNIQSVLFEDFEEDGFGGGDYVEDDVDGEGVADEDDTASVDSDDYAFALRPVVDESIIQTGPSPSPPYMIIASGSDMVSVRMSDIDDAIGHALSQLKPAMALNQGLRHRRQLRRYKLNDLVDNYLHAVLKVGPPKRQLSLRRMKMAIQSMPVLLGGQIKSWDKWSQELERIPGSLFLLRNYLPVRDPILPSDVYERVLQRMFIEVDEMSKPKSSQMSPSSRLDLVAAKHFLESILAWGPTSVLKEFIKLYKYSREKCNNGSDNIVLRPVEVALQRRYLQTSAVYLNFPVVPGEEDPLEAAAPRYEAYKDDSKDSLFRVDEVLEWMIPRAPLAALPQEIVSTTTIPDVELNNQTSLDAIGRLRMMQLRYDLSLKAFLTIGLLHSPLSMQQIESDAINSINGGKDMTAEPVLFGSTSYAFVLGIIENHHLHQILLDENFVSGEGSDGSTQTPLFALLRTIGLSLMGEFLMEHCVSPEFSSSSSSDREFGREPVRKETLPLDEVARQLEQSPALLYWYLQLVFTKKPELYVKFPNNAIPPKAVTELHRKHFKLHVRFAGDARDSAKSLAGTEVYKVEAKTTPLLSFLKATLPLGGVLPVDARRELEIQRSDPLADDSDEEKEDNFQSSSFSLELAYIIENYSDQTEAEALGVLDLYLEGANSLMLAVSYAQRTKQFSSVLWDKLISYCLPKTESGSDAKGDGMLFGALLEAAALSGANLARLVARIPPGMVVEGLRPRLVAAVADYRFKLDIHQAAAAAASEEQVDLLREVAHRSRRGVRYSLTNQPKISESKEAFEESKETEAKPLVLSRATKTVERRGHHRLAFSIPMR